MAITYELSAESTQPADRVFATIVDLAQWDDYAGVQIAGPMRAVTVGDRVHAALDCAGLRIQAAFRVAVVEPPHPDAAGRVEMVSCGGPIDGTFVGTVVPTATGCRFTVSVRGKGKGPVRFLESALTLVASRWVTHQSKHLLGVAASR